MSAFWTTASPIDVEQYKDSVDEAKADCDAYRKINANRNSVSVQSYRAKVNKERNANMVAQEQLSINEEKSMIMAYYITGLVVVLILLGVGIVVSRKYNRRLKKMREELNEARKVAENSMHLKSLFLSNMSHEIRTPLNALAGFSTSLAHDTQLTMEERTQFANIIRKDTELLMYLVNGVLDFSRLEAGMTKWQITRCDIIKICHEAIDAAALKWPEANFSIHGNLKPFIINTDAGRMRQVIDSMLTGTVGVNKVEGNVIIYSNVINNEMSLRVVNSPLSLPNPSNEAVQLRHDINRLTLEFFNGKYCQNPISIILRRQSV